MSTTSRSPLLERLESIELLSTACPVISGHVFLDENPGNPALTNNGLLDPGETPFANAAVELVQTRNGVPVVLATTTTGPDGSYAFSSDPTASVAPRTIAQVLTLSSTLTNFQAALAPALQLFDPTLGTLTAVRINGSANLSSVLKVANTSASGSVISGSQTGGFTVDGLRLPEPLAGSFAPNNGPISIPPTTLPGRVTPGSDFTLPLATAQSRKSFALTDPASLAFYTAAAGRASIAATMTANAKATTTATNGNTDYQVNTSGSATVSVSFDYVPSNCLAAGAYTIIQTPEVPNVIDGKESRNFEVLPPNGPNQSIPVTINNGDSPNNDFAKLTCGMPVSIVRFGIHQQPTMLVARFDNPVDPAQANNPANYVVTSLSGRVVPVSTASYDATTSSVTLVPSARLNAHYHFNLHFNLPCYNGKGPVLNFGGKSTLAGYFGPGPAHHFHPIVNGHLVPA